MSADVATELARLASGASALGVSLDDAALSLLLAYLDRIYCWNRSAGLTGVARAHAVRLHLLDSLSVVRFLPTHGSFADLGSGAGLPGIPVAVALPSCRVALVESRRRKCTFLRETIRDLALRNCDVIESDARRLVHSAQRFDAVMARAFVSPRALASLASDLLVPGGRLLVMGARRHGELAGAGVEAGFTCSADEQFLLPDGQEQRRIMVWEKPPGQPRQTP